MGKVRTIHLCGACGQQLAQWSGRCPGCGAWGTIGERVPASVPGSTTIETLGHRDGDELRVPTGWASIDRVLGGGLVPAAVALLAGEPGIGKSTLLLQLAAGLSTSGLPCLLASGEESLEQVSARAHRIGLDLERVSFVHGRELGEVVAAARAQRPFFLAVDSVQTLRDPSLTGAPGGPSQVRGCADELVALAKQEGIAVVMTGHVTKDGDLAGPRTLEHAVDVVLTFEGDARSGQRVLAGGKNRFGPEGEIAWYEMRADGLRELDPALLLAPGGDEPGTAIALPIAGRRALAVEIQALVVPTDGPARRQVTGLDSRRFQLVAAVVERALGLPLSRAELYGATTAGLRLDDPGCDLAIAAALASAATGRPPPSRAAFAGEVGLTGGVRAATGMDRRLAAAKALGLGRVIGPPGGEPVPELELTAVLDLREALGWASAKMRDTAA